MKGTEKQIKWAEDIIAEAREYVASVIRANEERAAQYPSAAKMYTERAEQYKRFSAQLEETISKIDDAAIIIDKRDKFSVNTIRKFAERA